MKQQIVSLLEEMCRAEGYNKTVLEDVTLFRAVNPIPTMPIVYDQCLCIAAQGSKVTRTTDMTLEYDPGRYLVVPTIVPFECESHLPDGNPLLGVTINIDFTVVQEVIEAIGNDYWDATAAMAPHPGMYTEAFDEEMQESTWRLLKSLRNESEAAVLGRQMIREIYFRTLMGRQGHILASAAKGESAYARIAKSIRTIHENYADPLDVTHLAQAANMSVRSFHDHFKTATSCTPFQYLKRIRLDRARQLLARKGLQANVTAHMVGYESAGQFSREFKKHFGYPPSEVNRHFSPDLVRG